MKELPGIISSLDPPMVTAEMEKPIVTYYKYWSDKIVPGNSVFLQDVYRYDLQEYHKATEPMLADNTVRRGTEWYRSSKKYKYSLPELKLSQKVLFVRTGDKTCRVTQIKD